MEVHLLHHHRALLVEAVAGVLATVLRADLRVHLHHRLQVQALPLHEDLATILQAHLLLRHQLILQDLRALHQALVQALQLHGDQVTILQARLRHLHHQLILQDLRALQQALVQALQLHGDQAIILRARLRHLHHQRRILQDLQVLHQALVQALQLHEDQVTILRARHRHLRHQLRTLQDLQALHRALVLQLHEGLVTIHLQVLQRVLQAQLIHRHLAQRLLDQDIIPRRQILFLFHKARHAFLQSVDLTTTRQQLKADFIIPLITVAVSSDLEFHTLHVR